MPSFRMTVRCCLIFAWRSPVASTGSLTACGLAPSKERSFKRVGSAWTRQGSACSRYSCSSRLCSTFLLLSAVHRYIPLFAFVNTIHTTTVLTLENARARLEKPSPLQTCVSRQKASQARSDPNYGCSMNPSTKSCHTFTGELQTLLSPARRAPAAPSEGYLL